MNTCRLCFSNKLLISMFRGINLRYRRQIREIIKYTLNLEIKRSHMFTKVCSKCCLNVVVSFRNLSKQEIQYDFDDFDDIQKWLHDKCLSNRYRNSKCHIVSPDHSRIQGNFNEVIHKHKCLNNIQKYPLFSDLDGIRNERIDHNINNSIWSTDYLSSNRMHFMHQPSTFRADIMRRQVTTKNHSEYSEYSRESSDSSKMCSDTTFSETTMKMDSHTYIDPLNKKVKLNNYLLPSSRSYQETNNKGDHVMLSFSTATDMNNQLSPQSNMDLSLDEYDILLNKWNLHSNKNAIKDQIVAIKSRINSNLVCDMYFTEVADLQTEFKEELFDSSYEYLDNTSDNIFKKTDIEDANWIVKNEELDFSYDEISLNNYNHTANEDAESISGRIEESDVSSQSTHLFNINTSRSKIVHTCHLCEHVYSSKAALLRHLKLHLFCKYCKRKFKSEELLISHFSECLSKMCLVSQCYISLENIAESHIIRMKYYDEFRRLKFPSKDELKSNVPTIIDIKIEPDDQPEESEVLVEHDAIAREIPLENNILMPNSMLNVHNKDAHNTVEHVKEEKLPNESAIEKKNLNIRLMQNYHTHSTVDRNSLKHITREDNKSQIYVRFTDKPNLKLFL